MNKQETEGESCNHSASIDCLANNMLIVSLCVKGCGFKS